MKNFLSVLVFVTFCGILNAQIATDVETKMVPSHPGLSGVTTGERVAPFYTEDFGGGLPAGWAVIDSSGICPWKWSLDGSWGYFSQTGENSGDPAISSTTGGNGFLICDNDSANHVNYGQPSGANYQYLSSYIGTSAIDCSTQPSVILRFEQAYRYNNGVPMFVMVSTDSSNWTAFDVSGDLANNQASADPDVEVVNLSAIAANQPTVYLRFGWSARVYFWMIDDISLSEADPNDISMESGYWGSGIYQNQYFKIPTTQWSPLTFYGGINNLTGGTLNNVFFDVEVNDGSTVFSGTSNLMNLNATATDTTTSATNWTPSAIGDYDVTFTADLQGVTDSNLTNNIFNSALSTTASIYALDNLPANLAGSTGGISNFNGFTGQIFAIGNYYEVIADDEIECVEIGLTSNANNSGAVVYGAIYSWDGSAWVYEAQTPDYSVQAGDLGNTITVPFSSPVSVSAGEEIVVVAGHFGGLDAEFMMAQNVPDQMVWGLAGDGSWYWLSAPRALVVRANFDCPGLGTEELNNENNIRCYPNPASDQVNVDISLEMNANVQINMYDINGKIIYTNTPVELTMGNHVLQIEADKYEAGTYTVEVVINENKTRQLIVIK